MCPAMDWHPTQDVFRPRMLCETGYGLHVILTLERGWFSSALVWRQWGI